MKNSSIAAQKKALRQALRRKTQESYLHRHEQENKILLKQIKAQIQTLPPSTQHHPTTILLYNPLPKEPHLLALLSDFYQVTYRFVFPRMEEEKETPQKKLLLYEWHPNAHWITNHHDLKEPDPARWNRVPLQEVDLALIPGLGFDLKGGRLGRGGGFFDRLLSQPECRCLKTGVAWSWQIVPTVPMESTDVSMDRVVVGS